MRNLTIFIFLSAAGCSSAAEPVNPSFSLSVREADAAIERMRAAPKALKRPLVVVGGYLDPGLGPWWVAKGVKELVGDGRVIEVQFPFCSTFDECRTKVLQAVDRTLPSSDAVWTAEVDVLAISMGGLVARHSAAPPESGASSPRRLRIARLFTISSPHRGARLASIPCFLSIHHDMRPGSRFLRRLEEVRGTAGYVLFPYVRLGDRIVGAENAAPPGQTPWWVPGGRLQPAHIGAVLDARIRADIASRLRGEDPFTTAPAARLPVGGARS